MITTTKNLIQAKCTFRLLGTSEADGDPVHWIYFFYKLTFHYFDSYTHSSWRCTQSCTHQRVFHGYGGIPRRRQGAWF